MNEYTCPCCGEVFVDSGVTPTGVTALREDALFTSSNYWGLPDLLPNMMADEVCIPKTTYGGGDVTKETTLFVYDSCRFPSGVAGNVLGFYTQDDRFEHVWTEAVKTLEKLMPMQWRAVIAPNFSVFKDDPLAAQIWNVYRSRWIARYWQEVGIRIIPDLNWADSRSFEFAWAGIPEGCPVASVQARTTRSKAGQARFIEGLTAAVEAVEPQNLIVYGGENADWIKPKLPEKIKVHFLDSFNAVRKRKHGLKNRTA